MTMEYKDCLVLKNTHNPIQQMTFHRRGNKNRSKHLEKMFYVNNNVWECNKDNSSDAHLLNT